MAFRTNTIYFIFKFSISVTRLIVIAKVLFFSTDSNNQGIVFVTSVITQRTIEVIADFSMSAFQKTEQAEQLQSPNLGNIR